MYSTTPRPASAICCCAARSCSPQSQRTEPSTSPSGIRCARARVRALRSGGWTPPPPVWECPGSGPCAARDPPSRSRSATRSRRTWWGGSAEVSRWIRRSFRRRHSMTSRTLQILMSCSAAKASSCGIRAMLPSGFITSQITPTGLMPARRHRSIEPSVCPARRNTPSGCPRIGYTWPGRARSSTVQSSRAIVRMVVARSVALTPVVTPSRASIETVNWVPNRELFTEAWT